MISCYSQSFLYISKKLENQINKSPPNQWWGYFRSRLYTLLQNTC